MVDRRLIDVGDVIETENGPLVCTSVQFRETEEHGRYNFTYIMKNQVELQQRIVGEEQLKEALERQQEGEDHE